MERGLAGKGPEGGRTLVGMLLQPDSTEQAGFSTGGPHPGEALHSRHTGRLKPANTSTFVSDGEG